MEATGLGVIDSLSAGYRFLGRRLELLLIPVALDILLWLGPRFSVAPLSERLAGFYAEAARMEGVPPDMAAMTAQVADMLTEVGRHSNLMEVMVSGSLLHVPSLLVAIGPVAEDHVFEIDNPLAAAVIAGVLGLIGLLLGVVYMNLLARRLPLGGAAKPATAADFARTVLRHWLMVLLFILMVAVLVVAGAVPVVLGTALLTFLSPALGMLMMLFFSGGVMVLFFYLYFVAAALVMDNLPLHMAVAQSFTVVRKNFWSTLAFIVLTSVISLGIALIMQRLTAIAPIGTAVAIVINAYIGSGLAMALLVFYRTRILHAAAEEIAG
ncbi:MAG: hypothetical protein QM346_12840 [Chloroflexota bacterium]|nr:hypothetical protein [Chloroflexota bacterium]